MPFKFTLKRARRYNVSSKNSYVVCVHLLDKNLIECTLTAESTGHECLENIAQRIELNEGDFFGLRYVNKKLQFRWIELDKPLKKQLDKHAHSPLLYFGVMFYVADAHKIQDEIARYQYYLQLKTDVIEGKLPCTPEQAVLLAAYSVQAKLGDHDSERHTPEQLKEMVLLPRTMTTDDRTLVELTQEIVNTHKNLQSVAPPIAELNYIIEAQQLEGYGLEYFPAKGDGNIDLLIGASFIGIFVKPINSQPTMYFKWSKIINLTQSGKKLSLETSLTDKNVNFVMDDPDTAKYVYKIITLQHQFCKRNNLLATQTIPKSELPANIPGSSGVMPDIQQSVQPQSNMQNQSQEPISMADHTQQKRDISNQTMIINETLAYGPSPIQQYEQPQSNESPYPNGNVFNIMHQDTGQLHSTPLHPLNNNNLHSLPQSTSTPNYVNRRNLLPAYRPTPDYETVMRQRMEQMSQQAQSGQNIHMHQASLDHHTQLANLANISNSQVYLHPETMAYSQPEISHNPPPSYTQYLAHRGMITNGAVNYSVVSSGSDHSPTRPVDRTSSLIIHPTYSTPELHTQGLPSQFSTSENYLINETIYNQYKPPPPYPRPSSSTPDLATQTARPTATSSPDLVSRRNLHNVNLVAQSQFDQSVENLAMDTHNLMVSQQRARSSQNILDDTSSGTQSESVLLGARGSIPDVAAASGSVSLVNLDSSEFQEVMITSPPQPSPQMYTHSTPVPPFGHSAVDGYLPAYKTSSGGGSVPNLEATSSQYPTCNVCSPLTASASTAGERVRDMPASNLHPTAMLGADNQTVYVLPDSERDYSECLPTPSPQQNKGGVEFGGVNFSTSSHPEHATCSSSGEGRSLQMIVNQPSTPLPPRIHTEDSDSGSDYEEIETENKRLSMGPMKLAAMNGLTVSSGSILDPEPNIDSTSRAPKDDRRKQLENKLEEGQVFVEFEQVYKKKIKFETGIASQPDNKERNRFKDVLPYDENRVKLMPRKDNPTGYINASHVKMHVGKDEWWYLAAQGPLPNTLIDFWQMIWEQEVEVVAMLTGLMEHGRPKCARYWPEKIGAKNKIKFGEYDVSLKFCKNSGPYVTSGLTLRHTKLKKERLVWHLQYTDWPDHGCPDDPHGFLAYLDEIDAVRRQVMIERKDNCKIPIVVHCSAGVGRSGVVILTEVVKACLEFNQEVDVPAVLREMRDQRMYMVQTVSQYSFVYKSLVEYLKGSRLI